MPNAGFGGEPGWMYEKREIVNEDIKGETRNPNDIQVGQEQPRPCSRDEGVERYARQSECVSRFTWKRAMNVRIAMIWEGVRKVTGGNGPNSRLAFKRKSVIEEKLADGIRHARWLRGEETRAVNQRGHTGRSVPRSAEDQRLARSLARPLGRRLQVGIGASPQGPRRQTR